MLFFIKCEPSVISVTYYIFYVLRVHHLQVISGQSWPPVSCFTIFLISLLSPPAASGLNMWKYSVLWYSRKKLKLENYGQHFLLVLSDEIIAKMKRFQFVLSPSYTIWLMFSLVRLQWMIIWTIRVNSPAFLTNTENHLTTSLGRTVLPLQPHILVNSTLYPLTQEDYHVSCSFPCVALLLWIKLEPLQLLPVVKIGCVLSSKM